MKARMWIAASLLVAVALAAPAFAQPKAGRPAPAADGGAKKARARKLRDKVLRERVGLDAQKAAHVEKVIVDYQQKQKAIRKDIRDSRQRLRELFKSDSDDQAAYKEALTKFRKAHADLAKLREAEFTALDAKLTPKEQAKLLGTLVQVRRHLNRQRAQAARKERQQERQEKRQEKRKDKPPRKLGPKR